MTIYINMPREKNSKARGRRQQISNFYITLNTNKKVKNTLALTPAEEKFYKEFIEEVNAYLNQSPDALLKFNIPGDNADNSVKDFKYIWRPELQSAKTKAIHIHALLEVKHFTKLSFNIDKMRRHFIDKIGAGVYLQVQLAGRSKEDIDAIRDYIMKEDANNNPAPIEE